MMGRCGERLRVRKRKASSLGECESRLRWERKGFLVCKFSKNEDFNSIDQEWKKKKKEENNRRREEENREERMRKGRIQLLFLNMNSSIQS